MPDLMAPVPSKAMRGAPAGAALSITSQEKFMNKFLSFLGGLVALFSVSMPSLGAVPASAADGRMAAAEYASDIAAPSNTGAPVTIYSNFNTDPNNLYYCCSSYIISGVGSLGADNKIALPFTPASNAKVTQITLPVDHATGVNGVTVTLYADDGGRPGMALKTVNLTGIPEHGLCCATLTVNLKGVPVTAGAQYWVAVGTSKKTVDTLDYWHVNNIGVDNTPIVGTLAWSHDGSAWVILGQSLPAMQVMGK